MQVHPSMRVLIVDNDSEMLQTTALFLRDGFSIDIVTSKADALDLLRHNDFHVLVACEQLTDGTGLDLLSQAAARWPQTLRIFVATHDRLALLRGRLGPFKLFQTLLYPIDAGQLGSILMLAQAAQAADANTADIQHIVLGDQSSAASTADLAPIMQPAAVAASAPATRPIPRPEPFSVPARPANTIRPAVTNAPLRPQAPPRPAPSAPSVAPARRRPVTRDTIAAVHRLAIGNAAPKPAAPVPGRAGPRRAPLPRAADILPALAKLRAGLLQQMPQRFWVRHKPLLMVAGIVMAIAAVVIAAILVVGSLDDSPSSASLRTAGSRDPGAALVREIEGALTADQVRKARRALERLRRVAPKHERLAFFEAIIARREALGRTLAEVRARDQEAERDEFEDTTSEVGLAFGRSDQAGSAATEALTQDGLPVTSDPGTTGPAGSSTAPASGSSMIPADALVEDAAAPSIAEAPGPALAPVVPARTPVRKPITSVEDLPPVIREAKLIRRSNPDYPREAAATGTEGYVDIAFVVTAGGRVKDPYIVAAEPANLFDRAALTAVRSWRYEPRVEDGTPVDWPTQVRIEFKLGK